MEIKKALSLSKLNVKILLFLIFWVFLVMFFTTGTSPLLNRVFGDSAVHMTMGRAMAKGKIVYKEIFDNKGLYVYFLNCLGLGNGSSFTGLFFIEALFMCVNAILVFLICSRFYSGKVSLVATSIFILFSLNYFTFNAGNYTEEYAWPFQLLALYLLIKYLDGEQRSHRPFHMFLHGIMAGFVLGLRPNLTLMWGPVALLVAVDLIKKRDIKGFFMNLCGGMLGLFVGVAPMLLYAILHDAVHDMFFCMFEASFIMHISGGTTLPGKFLRALIASQDSWPSARGLILQTGLLINGIMPVLLSAVVLCGKNIKSRSKLYYLTLLFICLLSVSLSGRNYGHYYMYIAPFSLPLICEISRYSVESGLKSGKARLLSVMLVLLVLSSSTLPLKILNWRWGGVSASEKFLSLWQGCAEINKKYFSDGEKVLVVPGSVGHAPFYAYMGVVPDVKYFYVPPFNPGAFPGAFDSQINSLLSGTNDVLVLIYQNEKKEICPAEEKEEGIRRTLANFYTLLYSDEANRVEMYGKRK